MEVIEAKGVWEKYRIKFVTEGKVSWEEFWALKDINFVVEKGEVLGIIGENGAGKTTLLKLIAGMIIPDRGEINVQGKVSTIMELGAGFNPEFTGRENIILNARMYGLGEELLKEQIGKIVEFANLGKFIDAPIKYYSQGMYLRLAFALAIFTEPDILLIDDILAVGDEEAQQKCIKKIFELKRENKTIVVVSHDMNMIAKLCERVIVLEKGKIIYEGLPEKAISRYLETVGDKKGIGVLEKEGLRVIFNNGRIIFSYRDWLLTKDRGGYISYFVPSLNSWVSSLNLSWEVKYSASDRIIAEGRNFAGIISEIWVLHLQKNRLSFQIEMKEEDIREPHMDLLLMPQYKKWVTLDREGDFPPFIYKTEWHDLSINNCPEGIIGFGSQEESPDLPNLVVEIENKDGSIRLFNSGYEQEARIIQSYLKRNILTMNIEIFPQKDEFKAYLENKRKIFVIKQKQEFERLISSRTISSGNLRLFADLENKALRLYYKDKEITKADGIHSSFLIGKSWYGTSSAEWEIEKKENNLILNLYWKQLKLTQSWGFSLKEGTLDWVVRSEFEGTINFELLKFGLLLTEGYKSFFCGHQEGKFPEEFSFWQDIPLEDQKAEFFGVRKEDNFPAIVLENKGGYFCIIQNSDSSTSCRALQMGIFQKELNQKTFFFTTRINICEDETFIEGYIKDKRQKLILKQEEERARLRALRTISSGNLRLFADLENKALRLYYKDKEITENRCLYTVIYIKGEGWFHSFDVPWQIEKISEKRLILTLNYKSLSLLQIWTLSCAEDVLEIKIEVEVTKPIMLTNRYLSLELSDKYKKWYTAYEQGDFSVTQYINNIAPIRLKDNKVPQVLLEKEISSYLPYLIFEVTPQPYEQFLSIYKNKLQKESICLNFSSLVPRKDTLLKPGRYDIFGGKIVLDKVIKLEKDLRIRKVVELKRANLNFIFDRGKGKIFWKDEELTAGLGVYTSLRISGIWYDSYQGVWEVIALEKDSIILKGDWLNIPISQNWRIELSKENLIIWNIEIEIHEEVDLEIQQANLMLSKEYKNWKIPGIGINDFPDEFTQEYDILPYRCWYGIPKKEGIMATGNNLPDIIFRPESESVSLKAIVENTDYLYQARLLQYQRSNIGKLFPHKYHFFSGIIEIRAHDKI